MEIIQNIFGLKLKDGTPVDSNNPLPVREHAFVDSNNSSATPLGIGGVFTGTATEITQYGVITVAVYSDVASATDGLELQQSTDGTNWDHCDNFTIPAAKGKTFSVQPTAMYFRIVYTNGGTGQSVLGCKQYCIQIMLNLALIVFKTQL